MSYAITTDTLQPQATASIRVTVPAAEIGPTMGQIIVEVMAYLNRLGIHPAGPPFARYYETGPVHVTMEVGFPVAKAVAPSGRVTAGELPGGEVAVTWHIGPYEKLGHAYAALESWVKEHSRESSGPAWEIYWSDPGAPGGPTLTYDPASNCGASSVAMLR